jgi:hypothetical protein
MVSPGRRFSVPDVLASSRDTGCAGGRGRP